jgi:hypothetical protein
MESSDVWYKTMGFEFTGGSSCLFDTTGIYAAITHENLNFEELPVYLNDNTVTVVDPVGKMMSVARTWDDKDKFYEYMINRQGDIYWVVPHKGLDYMIPFAAEDFHKRFEDVNMEGNKHEV